MLGPQLRLLSVLIVAAAPASRAAAGEVIREQDAAGCVRVVREVAEDASGNCVNHGLWQQFAADGRLVAEGQYARGRRTGNWRRWIVAADAAPSLAPVLAGFTVPFLSQASFVDGQLHGVWIVSDALQRPCLEIACHAGQRHGDYHQWNPDGRTIRRETYRHGLLDGEAFARDEAEQRLVHTGAYIRGYRVVRAAASFTGGAGRRCEGDFLVGPQTVVAGDDFWECRLAQLAHGVECIPHGPWRQWHANGQLAANGRYDWGRPSGEFVWRHANGQKAAAGAYADGQPCGPWRWWNADGVQTASRSLKTSEPPAAVAHKLPPAQAPVVR